MKRLILSVLFLLVSTAAFAQTNATPASQLLWDYPNTTQAAAAAFGEKYYVDAVATGVALTGKSCVVVAPSTTATCSAAFPALAPGAHTLAVSSTSNGLESAKSNSVSFTFVVLVTPANLRIGKNEVLLFPSELHAIATWHHEAH